MVASAGMVLLAASLVVTAARSTTITLSAFLERVPPLPRQARSLPLPPPASRRRPLLLEPLPLRSLLLLEVALPLTAETPTPVLTFGPTATIAQRLPTWLSPS